MPQLQQDATRNKLNQLLESMNKVILGKETETKEVVLAVLAGGHILLEDIPGVGKTTLALTLAKLLDLGIPCSFLTRGGRWRGMMDGDPGFHAGRRMLQYKRVSDVEFVLRLARRIVADNIANSRRTLQRLAARLSPTVFRCRSSTTAVSGRQCISSLRRTVASILRAMDGASCSPHSTK